MKHALMIAAIGVGIGLSAPDARAALDIRTGLWEITSSTEALGGSPEAEVTRACIDHQTLRRGLHFSPGKRGNCTRTLVHGSTTVVELRLECTGEPKASGTFQMRATDRQTIKGKLDLVVDRGSGTATVKRTMTGVWISNDCGTVKREE